MFNKRLMGGHMTGPVITGEMLSSMNQHMGAGKGVGSVLDFTGAKNGGAFPAVTYGLSVNFDTLDPGKTLGGLNPPQPQIGMKLTEGFGRGVGSFSASSSPGGAPAAHGVSIPSAA